MKDRTSIILLYYYRAFWLFHFHFISILVIRKQNKCTLWCHILSFGFLTNALIYLATPTKILNKCSLFWKLLFAYCYTDRHAPIWQNLGLMTGCSGTEPCIVVGQGKHAWLEHRSRQQPNTLKLTKSIVIWPIPQQWFCGFCPSRKSLLRLLDGHLCVNITHTRQTTNVFVFIYSVWPCHKQGAGTAKNVNNLLNNLTTTKLKSEWLLKVIVNFRPSLIFAYCILRSLQIFLHR